jgi:hypothetical protein
MATAHFVVAQVNSRGLTNAALPIPLSVPMESEAISTSGTSQATTAAVPGTNRFSDHVWIVSVSGGNVWVKFGATPTAAAGNDWLIQSGETREFGATVGGEKAAVIDA